MTSALAEITDAEFEQAVRAARHPVLIEFYTQNCAHCQRLEPLLENAAQSYAGRADFLRMDAQNNETRPQYGLHGTPTLALYIDGEEIVTKTGSMREQQLRAFLRHYL